MTTHLRRTVNVSGSSLNSSSSTNGKFVILIALRYWLLVF